VLADLVDSSGAQVEYLPDIPPEFHQPGLDGAMFTLGTGRPALTCVTVFRFLPDAHKRVVTVLRRLGDTVPLAEVFRQADAAPDPYVVQLEDDAVTQPEVVRSDWLGLQVADGVLGLPSGTSEPDAAEWRRRARAVAVPIGLPAVPDEHLAAQPGDCGAALLVSVVPIPN
jgi:hypothetical protein